MPHLAVLIALFPVPSRTGPTNVKLGQVYAMTPYSTGGLVYNGATAQPIMVTVVVPTSLSNYNGLTSIMLTINGQTVALQPGHNYFNSTTTITAVSAPIISDPTFNVLFTSYPLLFYFSRLTPSNASQPVYPLLVGYNLLLANVTAANLTFLLVPYAPQIDGKCLLFFQDLVPNATQTLPLYYLTSLPSGQTAPFFRSYANSFYFVQNSAALNATVSANGTSLGQSVLFFSFCVSPLKARAFQNDFMQVLAHNQEGLIHSGNFADTGTLALGYAEVRRKTLTVRYYPAVVAFQNSALGALPGVTASALPFTYNSLYFQQKLGRSSAAPTVFTPVDLNQPVTVSLSTGVNYLVNYRAGIYLPSGALVGAVPGCLDFLSIDLGYWIVDLDSGAIDSNKRGWLFTGIFLILSSLFLWGGFVYFCLLGRFLRSERIKRQSYDKYFKKVREADADKERGETGSSASGKLLQSAEAPPRILGHLSTRNSERGEEKERKKVHINVFKDGFDLLKVSGTETTPLQSPRFAQPETPDPPDSNRRSQSQPKRSAVSRPREEAGSGRKAERVDTQPKDASVLPANAHDLTFKMFIADGSVSEG